jgi:hypothetical protein
VLPAPATFPQGFGLAALDLLGYPVVSDDGLSPFPLNLTIRLFGFGAMPAPEDDILGTMLAFAAIGIPVAYAALQIHMLQTSKGRWWPAAAVPLAVWAVWVAVLAFRPDGDRDPSEILAREIMAACCLGMTYLWLLRRLRRWRFYRTEMQAGGHLQN